MYTHRIQICQKSAEKNTYNQSAGTVTPVMECYAERTEFGGRENLYASRIVNENDVVYSIRWRDGIKAAMYVLDDGSIYKIVSVHPEGRRYKLHIKVVKNNTGDLKYVEVRA